MAKRSAPKDLLALPLAEWPEAEASAWALARQPRQGLFGAVGSAHGLRDATAASYVNGVGQWLAHLLRIGELLPDETPGERFQIDRLNTFVAAMADRGLKNSSIGQVLTTVKAAMCFIAPKVDLWILTHPSRIPLSKALPSEPRSLTVRDRYVAFAHLQKMHDAAMAMPNSPARRRQLRDVALAGIVINVAPRRSSLVRMRLDRLEGRADGSWLLRLRAEDNKTPIRLDLPLSRLCSGWMDDYLELARLGFPRAAETDHVWMGMKGPMTVEGISKAFEDFCTDCFGKAEGTHAARHWLRSEAGRVAPELAADAALVLGHSEETSRRYYAEARSLHAALRLGRRLREVRSGKVLPAKTDRARHPMPPAGPGRRRGARKLGRLQSRS